MAACRMKPIMLAAGLIGLAIPGATQIGFGIAVLVEQPTDFSELLAGEVFGFIDDHAQCRRLVKLFADKVVKAVQIVGRLFVDAVSLGAAFKFISAFVK
jgi:hypothetical protein